MTCPECDRELVSDQRSCVCGWGRKQAQARIEQVVRSTYRQIPFGITKAEFGVILFEVIKTIGAIKQLQHYLTILLEDPVGLTAMRHREQEARQRLATLFPLLTESESAEVQARYPEVVSW